MFNSTQNTYLLNGCFEMTRSSEIRGVAILFAISLGACRGPEVAEGDAAAVAPGASATSQDTPDPRVLVADTNRIMGNPSAAVWLVMASDFQCPACKYWHDTQAPEIMRDYVGTGKVRFAYINFPLDHLHPHARAAAEAAMCAAAQGKFWGIHDRLFAKQEEWAAATDPTPLFLQLATESGVDTAAWSTCLADDVMVPVVDGDRTRGRTGGVDQTPYFFIGDRKVGGAIPAAQLRPILDSALAKAGGPSR